MESMPEILGVYNLYKIGSQLIRNSIKKRIIKSSSKISSFIKKIKILKK